MKINVKVIPRSSQSKIEVQPDGSLKVKVKSVPKDGKANQELIEVLADYYKVSKNQIGIIKGLKSKNKVVKIYD